MGEVCLYNQVAAVVGLANLRMDNPGTLGGLIGYDLLSRFPVKVDFRRRLLTIYNPSKWTPSDSQYAVPLNLTSKVPSVEVEIDSAIGNFLVDLGNSIGLILHKSFADKHNLMAGFSDIKDEVGGISGIGGSTTAKSARGTLLRIGRTEIKRPALLVIDGEAGVLRSSELDGNLGNSILAQFLVLFDYQNRKLYLTPFAP